VNRNLFEFFLVKRNEGKSGKDREHLTVLCATSGDTGSAAIYGLRGKKDVSVFVMYPTGKVNYNRFQSFEWAILTPNPGEPNTGGTDDNGWVNKAVFFTSPNPRANPCNMAREWKVVKDASWLLLYF